MRRTSLFLILAVSLAACSSTKESQHDPFALLLIRNQMSDSVAADSDYNVLIVKVNQDTLIARIDELGLGDQGCTSYAGFPADSLDIQIWLAGRFVADTIKSTTFMPLTGPTPDSAAHWGVFFTDTGVIVQENPPGTFPCTF